MKNLFSYCAMWSIILLATPATLSAQNEKLISEEKVVLPDSIRLEIMKSPDDSTAFTEILSTTNLYAITYMSDGLKIKGYIAKPKKEGVYPVIIYNRGGNRDFGALNVFRATYVMGTMASWGYVVVGSNYRGGGGSEGMEEFGGKEVNDIRNLIPLLSHEKMADTSRMGLYGGSRGGMMTYLLLRNNCMFKAAVINSGVSDAFIGKSRPEMEKLVLAQLIPDYEKNKQAELEKRSAIYWADELCKSTPLLIMHGSADWRVPPEQALDMVSKLYELKHPVRFLFLEGASHMLWQEYEDLMWENTHRFFDHYVKEEAPLPDMNPHGN